MCAPTYKIIPEILSRDDLQGLTEQTESHPGNKTWYGRTSFWQETFLYGEHHVHNKVTKATDKLIGFIIEFLNEQKASFDKSQIVFDSGLDRCIVPKGQNNPKPFFWHQDHVPVGTESKLSDCTLVLLLSKNEKDWEGGNLVFQNGGHPSQEDRTWINSDNPKHVVVPKHNQAVIFRNDDGAHMVTPILPKNGQDQVVRDIFAVSCYIPKLNQESVFGKEKSTAIERSQVI